jgi:hypothetical protein
MLRHAVMVRRPASIEVVQLTGSQNAIFTAKCNPQFRQSTSATAFSRIVALQNAQSFAIKNQPLKVVQNVDRASHLAFSKMLGLQ